MGWFDEVTDLASDLTRIATAPVEIAAKATRTVTKPMRELTDEVVEGFKEMVEED